jgi:hypothetical protein
VPEEQQSMPAHVFLFNHSGKAQQPTHVLVLHVQCAVQVHPLVAEPGGHYHHTSNFPVCVHQLSGKRFKLVALTRLPAAVQCMPAPLPGQMRTLAVSLCRSFTWQQAKFATQCGFGCCCAWQVPGFATFEAMVRIFRVVRVFRVFRLGKRLKDEVLSRLLTLIFTLLAVIVTAAGVFYEIETRFSVSSWRLAAPSVTDWHMRPATLPTLLWKLTPCAKPTQPRQSNYDRRATP